MFYFLLNNQVLQISIAVTFHSENKFSPRA
jgi:hypothetical protein